MVGNRIKIALFNFKISDNKQTYFQNLGVYGAKGTPVPIPNTAVKLCRVDGTSWLHVGE